MPLGIPRLTPMNPRDTQPDKAPPLSTGAAARLLGVSVDTIREWEKQGRLRSFRTAGNQRRFPSDGVFALLEERAS